MELAIHEDSVGIPERCNLPVRSGLILREQPDIRLLNADR